MSDDDDCACLSVLVVCVILVPVYWLIVALGPLSFYPRVDSAVLAALDSSTTPPPDSTDAIRYNLSVDLSFNNSHPQVEIQYLSVAVAAFYGDFMLGLPDRTFPTPFSQGPSNTTVLRSSLQGKVAVFPDVAAELGRERAAGLVHLKVRVSLQLRYTVRGFTRLGHFYRYDCPMWFKPPPSDAAPAVFDAGTQCLPVK